MPQHSGIQSWSRGPLFPAVIAVVETYDAPATYEQWKDINAQIARHAGVRALYEAYLRNFFDRPLADRLIEKHWTLTLGALVDAWFNRRAEAVRWARAVLAWGR